MKRQTFLHSRMSCILWSGLSWQCTLLLLIRMEVGTEAEAQFNEPTFHIQWFSNNISVEVHIDFGTSFNNLISEQSSTRVPLSFPLVSGSAPDAFTPQQQSPQVVLHFDLFGYFQLVLFSPSLSPSQVTAVPVSCPLLFRAECRT